MDNNISFTSKIRFLPYEKYESLYESRGTLGYGINKFKDRFCTNDVATCTAGGFLNRNNEVLGFHFHNLDFEPNRMADKLEGATKDFDISRGLLVGSKDISGGVLSLEQFKFIKDFFSKKTNKMSMLQEHKNKLQTTSVHYDAKTDTWDVTTMNAVRRPTEDPFDIQFDVYSVEDAESLKKFYKKVFIADGDRLFIGDKEITKETNPEFFSK